MPCTAYSNIKDIIKYIPAPFAISDFDMGKGKLSYNMVGIKVINDEGKEELHSFATNIPIDAERPEFEANRIAGLYRSRWGIETGYRVKTHTFRPKTTSKDYRIRIFYFYFSILMYNLWILADILVWLALSNKVGEKHLIKAKFFRKQFSLIDPVG